MQKNITIVISSSIAWIKIKSLVTLLEAQNFFVTILATDNFFKNALDCDLNIRRLNTKMALQDKDLKYQSEHISLAKKTDLVICAPASMNFINTFSWNLAPEIVYTFLQAYQGPIIIAPSMNDLMWEKLQTLENFQKLTLNPKIFMIGPNYGRLYEGYQGWGRMAEAKEIAALGLNLLKPKNLAKIVISYGASKIYLDQIRYLSSDASGKFAFAIFKALMRLGLKAELIKINDLTNQELFNKVKNADVYVATGAVANFQSQKFWGKKSASHWEITLEKNLNVIQELEKKSQKTKVFAFKYDNELEKALNLFKAPNVKALLFNNFGAMGQDFINGELFLANKRVKLEKQSKAAVAKLIAQEIARWI